MILEEKQLSSNYLFKGRIINLRQDTALLPNGNTATREVIEHPGGVCVAALTDNDELLFVRQWRYPYMEETLEIPAGKRDRQDEDPLECGKRELREETGATAESYIDLQPMYPTPGYINEVIYCYLATGLTFGEQNPDEDEFLDVLRIPLEKAVEMVLSGEIKDAKTQIAVLKVKVLRDSGKI
ncbi:MAG: NUDIX hydrolase [Ruminococcaceae bacterium]|nr:NUDIX hydrolase [Oscillospiraceae bacterium]